MLAVPFFHVFLFHSFGDQGKENTMIIEQSIVALKNSLNTCVIKLSFSKHLRSVYIKKIALSISRLNSSMIKIFARLEFLA